MDRILAFSASRGITLRPHQLSTIHAVMSRRNTVCALPTGYGKSLSYLLPPLIWNQLQPAKKHVAVVVVPLRALGLDQVAEARAKWGVESACVQQDGTVVGSTADLEVVFTSPEAIDSGAVYTVLSGLKPCVIAIDEAHCLPEWGDDFRHAYHAIPELRSKFPRAPCLCLSGTMTKKIFTRVSEVLKLGDPVIVSECPDRPEIFLEICHRQKLTLDTELAPICEQVRTLGRECPKTLIYAQDQAKVLEIFRFFVLKLGFDIFCGERSGHRRLVQVFHANIANTMRQHVLTDFKAEASVTRVVISTIAYGMGVHVPNVRRVIHWGKSKSLLTHWQEIGRAGRDGSPSTAAWFITNTTNEEYLKMIRGACMRTVFLNFFTFPGMNTSRLDVLAARTKCELSCNDCRCMFCVCCSNCKRACPCRLR